MLLRLGVLPDASALPRPVASAVTVTTALGFSLGVVWEIFEWLGHTFVDDARHSSGAESPRPAGSVW
ncbi:hypothetical protein [Cryobacterium arcticum]|uniref:Uncharacterized protein n=1 Tax=Cryobacterium arcticum TaxID=670052 RepID=A0A1B1BPP8_9MICO|nr:hypothetical protein [Cryobacterium arcticum]ANP74622.1 hypothetical protein PA27867_3705 [Cryobacterium arcticum]